MKKANKSAIAFTLLGAIIFGGGALFTFLIYKFM